MSMWDIQPPADPNNVTDYSNSNTTGQIAQPDYNSTNPTAPQPGEPGGGSQGWIQDLTQQWNQNQGQTGYPDYNAINNNTGPLPGEPGGGVDPYGSRPGGYQYDGSTGQYNPLAQPSADPSTFGQDPGNTGWQNDTGFGNTGGGSTYTNQPLDPNYNQMANGYNITQSPGGYGMSPQGQSALPPPPTRTQPGMGQRPMAPQAGGKTYQPGQNPTLPWQQNMMEDPNGPYANKQPGAYGPAGAPSFVLNPQNLGEWQQRYYWMMNNIKTPGQALPPPNIAPRAAGPQPGQPGTPDSRVYGQFNNPLFNELNFKDTPGYDRAVGQFAWDRSGQGYRSPQEAQAAAIQMAQKDQGRDFSYVPVPTGGFEVLSRARAGNNAPRAYGGIGANGMPLPPPPPVRPAAPAPGRGYAPAPSRGYAPAQGRGYAPAPAPAVTPYQVPRGNANLAYGSGAGGPGVSGQGQFNPGPVQQPQSSNYPMPAQGNDSNMGGYWDNGQYIPYTPPPAQGNDAEQGYWVNGRFIPTGTPTGVGSTPNQQVQ